MPAAKTAAPSGTRTELEARQGLLFGLAAYVLWGAFPLYFPLLEPAGALEILAHRVLWSLAVMLVLVLALQRRRQFLALLHDVRQRRLLLFAGVLIGVNWGTYIWAVNNGHVVEAALGYFINPLVTVLMGVLILHETLRTWQWISVGIAGLAVLGLAVEYGQLPWVALVLAFSFGSYGLAKKVAGVEAIESLTYETMVLAPFALAFVVWLGATGRGHFTSDGLGHTLLLVSAGVVTAVPLLFFGAAAIRVPLTTIGLLQYLTPVLQFVIGVALLHEQMTPMRWVGFIAVWIALSLFTVEALQHRRRHLALMARSSPI